MNRNSVEFSDNSSNVPPLIADQYELQQRISETSLATFFHARDLIAPQTVSGKSSLIIAAVSPQLAAIEGFSPVWQRVMTEFTRPDSPLSIIDTCQSGGIYWVIFNQSQGEMFSERIQQTLSNKLSPAMVQAQLLRLLRASKKIMPNGGFGFLEPGAIWHNHNQCELLNAPLVIILQLLMTGLADQYQPISLQSAYLSPEISKGMSPTTQDDTFSIGCIAYHLLQGSVPFPHNSVEVPTLAFLKPEAKASLQRALSLQRHNRQASPYELVHAFTEIPTDIQESITPKFLRKTAMAGLALCGVGLLFADYSFYRAAPETTQSVQASPSLPAAVSITANLTTAVVNPPDPTPIMTKPKTANKFKAVEEKPSKPSVKVSAIKPEKTSKKKKPAPIKQTMASPVTEKPLLVQQPTVEIAPPPIPVKLQKPMPPPSKPKPATPTKTANIKVIQIGENTFAVATE